MINENKKHLENLSEIRSIMERSSSFLSLSGLGGIFAGIFALIGAVFAYWYIYIFNDFERQSFIVETSDLNIEFILVLFADATTVLFFALLFGFIFTYRNAKSKGLKVWNNTAKLLIISLFIPLVTGGIFILILLWHGAAFIIAGTTLVFYGLALLNASKYTHKDIKYLGIFEIIVGLIACIDIGYGLFYWAFGFGILHIIYGSVMFFKYERKSNK